MAPQIRRMVQNTAATKPIAYRKHQTCDRKKVYDNEEAGWAAVGYIQHNGNDPYPDFELRPYVCDFCGGIHVGHSNTPKSTEARLRTSAPAPPTGVHGTPLPPA